MAKEALKADVAEGGHEGRTDGGASTDDGAHGGGAGEMDFNNSQADDSAASSAALTIAYKAGAANFVVGGVVTVASAMMISGMVAVGFAAGYMIGVANIWMISNIVKKGVEMTPEEAGKYVASRYYLRYSATIIAFSVLIATGLVGAWPALAGLTVCIFTNITALIFAAREGVY